MSWNTCLHLTPFPLFLLELPLSTIRSPPALPGPPHPPHPHPSSPNGAPDKTHRLLLFPKVGEGLRRDVGGGVGGTEPELGASASSQEGLKFISTPQQSAIDVLAEAVVKPVQGLDCLFINNTAVALPNRLCVGRCGSADWSSSPRLQQRETGGGGDVKCKVLLMKCKTKKRAK